MSRRWIGLVLAGAGLLRASAQLPQEPPPPPQVPAPATLPDVKEPDQLPPEEDGDQKTEQFSFNPVKSKRDVAVGIEYFKKGNYKAAAGRFTTATKWNDGNAEAWLRLGEAEDKRGNGPAARNAYQKFLELSPDAKNAGEVRKRLQKLKA